MMQAIAYARSRATWAPALAFLGAALALGIGARPAEAWTFFAYVTNGSSNTVSVIDSVSNTVTATVAVGSNPLGSPSPRTGILSMWRIL
jgi:YVTN family beta-propeller protein